MSKRVGCIAKWLVFLHPDPAAHIRITAQEPFSKKKISNATVLILLIQWAMKNLIRFMAGGKLVLQKKKKKHK